MKFEIKKLFASKLIIICLVLLFGFFVFFVVNAYKSREEVSEPYEKLISDISDVSDDSNSVLALLKEKLEQMTTDYYLNSEMYHSTKGEYGSTLADDMFLYRKAYNDAKKYFKTFPQNRIRLINDAMLTIIEEESKENPDKSIIALNQKAVDKYNRQIKMELKSTGDLFNTLYFFDNTYWDYALIAFIIMLTVRMFTLDYSTGAYQIVFSTPGGKKKLFLKQYFTLIASAVTIIALVSLCQIIFGYLFFGVNNLSLPLQMVEYFEFCPFTISIGEYYLIKFLCKTLFFILVITLTAALSIIFRKTMGAMSISLVVFVLPLMIITHYFMYTTGDNVNTISEQYRIYKALQAITPQGLLNLKTYFNAFDYLNILGVFIPRITCCITITVIVIILFFTIGLRRFAKPKR